MSFLQSKRLERGAEKETRTLIAALILALVFIALDQITKAAVVKYIRFGELLRDTAGCSCLSPLQF